MTAQAQPATAPADFAAQPLPAAPGVQPAQAVRCGPRMLAILHGHARAALDRVDVSAVPHAPAWLAGATNVDGQIVPVLDLAAWCEPDQLIDPRDRQTRALLVGSGSASAALLFSGLPRLVQVVPEAPAPACPDALAPYVCGRVPDDPSAIAIDTRALLTAMGAALSR